MPADLLVRMPPPQQPPKSNTWVVLIPTAVWFVGGWAYVRSLQIDLAGRYDLIFAAGLSIPFLATAVAQVRSGFLWKNLACGNRGAHRSQAPLRFVLSTALHLVIGLAIACSFFVLSKRNNDDLGGVGPSGSEAGHPSPGRPTAIRAGDGGN